MNLASLPVTAVYAALCGLLVVTLAANVVRFRLKNKVSMGDGGHRELSRAIRAHGNAVEYIPLALLLMALLESNGAGHAWLHGYGILLVAGRLAHGFGMLVPASSANPPRQLGIVASWLVIIVASLQLLWLAI
ncbi:MAG: MAPEG family protein [Alcanivorax sp.]|nr:MAPEG family protein [Alcanivorax sp.]